MNQAGPKRTPYQRQHDRQLVADWYRQGLTQAAIAERINAERDYSLSQQTISNDLMKAGVSLSLSDEPGYVYLIKEDFRKLVKIGFSRHLDRRLFNIKSECPQSIEILYLFYVRRPECLEQMLHCKFASKKYKGEWFALDKNDVFGIIAEFSGLEKTDESGDDGSEIYNAFMKTRQACEKTGIQLALSL